MGVTVRVGGGEGEGALLVVGVELFVPLIVLVDVEPDGVSFLRRAFDLLQWQKPAELARAAGRG